MINFSLNTCWRLIPTEGASEIFHLPPFLYTEFLLPHFEDSDDNQQIASQTQYWRDDYSSWREDVGVESLFVTSCSGHQQVADNNQNACRYHDRATGYDETLSFAECSVHIV